MQKDIESLTAMFHPEHRNISFLNHFTLMMNFQIYNIESEILRIEILDISEKEATLTYTRKHMYTCVRAEDENGDNPNNISSYYVRLEADKKNVWIKQYARYSELFLNLNGEILPGDKAVVPPGAQFFANIRRFADQFRLEDLQPATYALFDDSEWIGYYPEEERFSYDTTVSFTIDFFEEMAASSIQEHTDIYIRENTLEYHAVLALEEEYSIVETKFKKNAALQHEIVLSILAPDGFFMMKYLKKNGSVIDEHIRVDYIEQMRGAVSVI